NQVRSVRRLCPHPNPLPTGEGAKPEHMADDATRDRVRALVRDVLSKAMPAESEAQSSNTPASLTSSAAPRPTVTRDESAKLVITEDDVRGLEEGAVLRIAENAKLTPLAADMVNDRGI